MLVPVPSVRAGLLPNSPVPVPKDGALVVVVPNPAVLLPNKLCCKRRDTNSEIKMRIYTEDDCFKRLHELKLPVCQHSQIRCWSGQTVQCLSQSRWRCWSERRQTTRPTGTLLCSQTNPENQERTSVNKHPNFQTNSNS